MLGYLYWEPEGSPAAVMEYRDLRGAAFLTLEAQGKERRVRRRVRRALEEMRRRGVRRWVVAENWPRVWREGVTETEVHPLRQALLPVLLEHVCTAESWDLSDAAVLLSAPRVDEAVRRTAELLIRRCRFLLLQMEGAEGLYRALWRRFGLPPGWEQADRLRLQVSFGEPTAGIPALLLGPGCSQKQRVTYQLPPLAEGEEWIARGSEQMAAALWSAGGLSEREIRVRSVEFHA